MATPERFAIDLNVYEDSAMQNLHLVQFSPLSPKFFKFCAIHDSFHLECTKIFGIVKPLDRSVQFYIAMVIDTINFS
jgi:hypothetical protein